MAIFSEHPNQVLGYNKGISILAKKLVTPTYQIAEFSLFLADDISKQAKNDELNERFELSSILYQASEHIYSAAESLSVFKTGSKILTIEYNISLLAYNVGNLSYDALASFMHYTGKELSAQGELKLSLNNKSDLVEKFKTSSKEFHIAGQLFQESWAKICKSRTKIQTV